MCSCPKQFDDDDDDDVDDEDDDDDDDNDDDDEEYDYTTSNTPILKIYLVQNQYQLLW